MFFTTRLVSKVMICPTLASDGILNPIILGEYIVLIKALFITPIKVIKHFFHKGNTQDMDLLAIFSASQLDLPFIFC